MEIYELLHKYAYVIKQFNQNQLKSIETLILEASVLNVY